MDLQTKLIEAKRRLSEAAASCLRNEPGAPEAADQAKAEVDALQAMKRAQGPHQCRFPGCLTLTVKTYCARHRPLAEWQISSEVKDELNQQHNQGETK